MGLKFASSFGRISKCSNDSIRPILVGAFCYILVLTVVGVSWHGFSLQRAALPPAADILIGMTVWTILYRISHDPQVHPKWGFGVPFGPGQWQLIYQDTPFLLVFLGMLALVSMAAVLLMILDRLEASRGPTKPAKDPTR